MLNFLEWSTFRLMFVDVPAHHPSEDDVPPAVPTSVHWPFVQSPTQVLAHIAHISHALSDCATAYVEAVNYLRTVATGIAASFAPAVVSHC